MLAFLSGLSARHEALKRRIHAFRMPVRSRAGLAALSVFYFTTPIVAGVYIMRWTDRVAAENLREVRERRANAPLAPR